MATVASVHTIDTTTRRRRTIKRRSAPATPNRGKLSSTHIPKGLTKGDEFVRQVGGKSVRFRVMAGTTPQGRRYRYALEIVAPRTKKKTTKKRTTKRRTTTGRATKTTRKKRRRATKTTRKKRTKKHGPATSHYRPLYG